MRKSIDVRGSTNFQSLLLSTNSFSNNGGLTDRSVRESRNKLSPLNNDGNNLITGKEMSSSMYSSVVQIIDSNSAVSALLEENEEQKVTPQKESVRLDKTINLSNVLSEVGMANENSDEMIIEEEEEFERDKVKIVKELQKKYIGFNSLVDQPIFATPPTEDVTLSEVLLEFELEKLQKKRDELIDGRNSLLTREPEKFTFSSVSNDILHKTFLDYRNERKQLIHKLKEIPTLSFPRPEYEHLEKLVQFCLEPKNTKEYMENFIISFYTYWKQTLKLKYASIVNRYHKYSDNSEIIERVEGLYKIRVREIEKEYEKTSARLNELKMLKTTEEKEKNIIKLNDFHVIIRKQLYDLRTRKKLDLFTTKVKWLCYSDRYNLFKKTFEFQQNSDVTAPAITTSKKEIDDQLENLKDCVEIKKTPSEETGQEFLYVVRNRFDAIFKAQSAKLKILPYPYKDSVENTDLKEKKLELTAENITYLKEATWVNEQQIIKPEIDSICEKQGIIFNQQRLDSQLQVEAGFLHTNELQYARKRLKEQADTHFRRANVEEEVQPYLNEGQISEREKSSNMSEEEINKIEGGKGSVNKIAAIYLLRYIRIREFKRKLLDILNYFRSIEKRLYYDQVGCATKSSSPSYIKLYYTKPDDIEKIESSNNLPLNITKKEDIYSLHLKRDIIIKDANGLKILYDAAIKDFENTEERLLKIGSYFILKNLEHFKYFQVDRFMVLEGLYESETWFQDSKRKVIDCFMEAYEHCYEPKERKRLAQIIINIMHKTPKLNMEAHYFSESYASEIICLELYHSLLRDIIKDQMKDEKEFLNSIHKSLDKTKSETSGIPDNTIDDKYLQIELFPGSYRTSILDFYTSLSIIGRLHEMVESSVNEIINGFKFSNVLAVNAIRRTILQQSIVEWKLLTKEEKVQKTVQQRLVEERIAVEDNIIMEDPCEVIACVQELINEEKGIQQSEFLVLGQDGDDALRETEGGFFISESDSRALQYYSNLIEMITLWRGLTQELYETDVLSNIYVYQGQVVGTTQKVGAVLNPINFETENTIYHLETDVESYKTSEVVSVRTQFLTNLAIVEFDNSMAELNLNTLEGIKRLLHNVGLGELRRIYQFQLVQRILLQVSVRYNQVPLDDYYIGQETNEFFLTAMNTNNISDEHKVTHLSKEDVQDYFILLNTIKIPIRQVILKEYQKMSDGIIQGKRPNMIRKHLRELKFRLAEQYCQSIMKSIQPFVFKVQIMNILRDFRHLLCTVEGTTGFGIGKPDHRVQVSARFMTQKLPTDSKDSLNKCILAKDGEVVNVTYIPHFVQILTLDFIPEEEENNNFDSLHSLLKILQRNYLITKFWCVELQTVVPLVGVASNEGFGLENTLYEQVRGLCAELDHLRQPENTPSVIEFLSNKCELLYYKCILALDSVKHKFRRESNFAAGTFVEEYMNGLMNVPKKSYCYDEDVFAILSAHLSKERRIKYDGLDTINVHSVPLKILNRFLFKLNEPERNYYSAESIAVSLLFDEVLTEEKLYATSMPEQSVSSQLEFAKFSMVTMLMRENFLQLSCDNAKYMLQDEEKMDELYSSTIKKKAKRIYEKEIRGAMIAAQKEQEKQQYHDSHEVYEAASLQRPKKKREKEFRQKQIKVLGNEISKILIINAIQELKDVCNVLRKETRKSKKESEDEYDLINSDGKLEIFHNFLSIISKNINRTKTKNGEVLITVSEKEFERALEQTGQKLQQWKHEQLQFLEKTSNNLIEKIKRNFFIEEQKVKYLLYKRDIDRKSLRRRIEAEVDDRNYDLVFLVNTLLMQNKELENKNRTVKSEVRKHLVIEYEDLVRALYKELIAANGKVAQYKKDVLRNLDQKFIEVKESTLLDIVNQQDVGDLTLKKKALEVIIEDNEVNSLRRENEDLNIQYKQLQILQKLKLASLEAKYDKLIRESEKKRDEALKELYSSKYEVGLRENQLRQELIKTQQQLSNAEMEVEQLRKDLQLQIKNKQKLVNWKVKNAQLLDELEVKVEKYERWSHTNVDKLLLELEEKKREAEQYSKLKERIKEKTNAVEIKSQKTIDSLKKKLLQEQKLKNKVMKQLSETKEQKSDIESEGVWQSRYWSAMEELSSYQKEILLLKNYIEKSGIIVPIELDERTDTPLFKQNSSLINELSLVRKSSTVLRPISAETSSVLQLTNNTTTTTPGRKSRPTTVSSSRASKPPSSLHTPILPTRPITVLPNYNNTIKKPVKTPSSNSLTLQRRALSAGIKRTSSTSKIDEDK
ncbi:hypothetical protein ABK040_012647 [Willaertia magna]